MGPAREQKNKETDQLGNAPTSLPSEGPVHLRRVEGSIVRELRPEWIRTEGVTRETPKERKERERIELERDKGWMDVIREFIWREEPKEELPEAPTRKHKATVELPQEMIARLREEYLRQFFPPVEASELSPEEAAQVLSIAEMEGRSSAKEEAIETAETVRLSPRVIKAIQGAPRATADPALEKVRSAFPRQAKRLTESQQPDSEKPASGVQPIQKRRERDEEKLALVVAAQEEMLRKKRAQAGSGENPLIDISDEEIENVFPIEPPKKEKGESAA